jgi:hypothetical protein
LKFPINHDEIKPAIKYINQHSRPGEALYVFRGAIPATRYYIKTGTAKFDGLQLVWGGPRKNSIDSYLSDLRQVKGRTWLLLSHMYPYNGSRAEENEIVKALQKRGTVLQHFFCQGCFVYEFDLQ